MDVFYKKNGRFEKLDIKLNDLLIKELLKKNLIENIEICGVCGEEVEWKKIGENLLFLCKKCGIVPDESVTTLTVILKEENDDE